MNSAAELKRFEADSKLQKDKQKVMSALANDPVGLSISQLMTVCRLSIKTVKNILSVIEVEQEDGVYFLKNQPKQVESNEITTEVFSGHKLLLLLRKNKDGYTAKEIMDIFSIGRGKLDNTILPDIAQHDTISEGAEYYSKEQWELLQKNLGVEITYERWDYMDIPEIPEEDSSDWSNWHPKSPDQDKFLIAAFDTEDGPVLWWAKSKEKTDAK